MREIDGLDDGYVRHCYLTRNFDEIKVDKAQIWSYNGTSRKNSDLMILWLANKPMA